MKLYHFLQEKWALEALNKQILKVSSYDDLNDPFELLSMSLSDEFDRKIMYETKRKLAKKLRILCCSKNWSSPLLWGHYADNHKGIALELEVDDDIVEPIIYAKDRQSINLSSLVQKKDDLAKKELFKVYMTKYKQWEYEEEYRAQFTQESFFNVDGHDFIRLGSDVKLVGLVRGSLNKTPRQEIENLIPKGQSITVTTSRAAFKSFNIVNQNLTPPYVISN